MKDTKLLVVNKKILQRVHPPDFLISKCVSWCKVSWSHKEWREREGTFDAMSYSLLCLVYFNWLLIL